MQQWRMIGIALLGMLGILVGSCQQEKPSFQNEKKVSTTERSELNDIDQEILDIEHVLSKYRHSAYGHEMEAQKDALVEWKAYSKEMKKEEQDEDMVHNLEKRVHELIEKKRLILEGAQKGKDG